MTSKSDKSSKSDPKPTPTPNEEGRDNTGAALPRNPADEQDREKDPRPEDYPPEYRVTPPAEQVNPSAATSVGKLARDGEPAGEEAAEEATKDATGE